MTDEPTGRRTCPLCGGEAEPDERRPAAIGGVEFRSIVCVATDMVAHPFPVRWLEGFAADGQALEDFEDHFTYVRGPLEEGTPLAELFAERDPIQAWIETEELDDGIRVLIRL